MKIDRMANMKIIVGALALQAICSAPVYAQDGGFFAGKTISLAVPSGPGGGYDTYARAFARHYPKHLPGKPQIVVQNTPGGGHPGRGSHRAGVRSCIAIWQNKT